MFNLYVFCWGSDTVYTAFVDPSLVGHIGLDNTEQKSSQRTGKKLLKTLAASEMLPLMDHWNTQTKKVSLREIMSEEIALQEKHDLVWVSINIKLLSLTLGWLCMFTCGFHLIIYFLVRNLYLTWLTLMLKLKNVLNVVENWSFLLLRN